MAREQFLRDGYAVKPVFDPNVVDAARADISQHIDRVSRALYLPFEQSFPDEPLETRLDRIWQQDRGQANLLRLAICTDAQRGPHLRELAASPALAATAQSLVDDHLAGENVVRVRAGIASFPQHLHAWHSDVACDDGTDCGRVCVTAWIPLTDAGPQRGGLEVVCGLRDKPFPHEQDRQFSISAATLAGKTIVQPECPAGSALFLHRFTPHRSLPVTGKARFALVVWMKSGGPADRAGS